MSSWEEVKRLAADFQKIQLSSTTQKLSERNCIEIVSWLLEKKLIDVIFSSDGKEYITPSQLVQDIRGELYVNGGRVNLVDLAKTLGVDLAHINSHLNEVLKGHKDIHSIIGQLIDSSYITRIAGEINETLAQYGQININELTIKYDLPADFLQQQVVEKHLGKLIFGKQDRIDSKLFYTEAYIERCKCKIRGALHALTKPTSVASLLIYLEMTEKLFFSLFDQVSPPGSVKSRTAGSQYVPSVYLRSQCEWVNNFYKQNGYLEYDTLTRLGISDFKTFIKKQFPNEELTFLNSCVVSKRILDRIEADIEECVSSKSYIDLQNNLPSVFNERDVKTILDNILSPQKQQQTLLIDNFILSKPFIDNLTANSDELLVKEKAKECVESGTYQKYQTDLQVGSQKFVQKLDEVEEKVDKRDERRKKASGGKSGGGTQGRETKTKSTKKHARSGTGAARNVEMDEEVEKKVSLEVVSFNEVKELIRSALEEEGLDDLIDKIAAQLHPKLNERAIKIAADIFNTTIADRTANRRQTHNELQNKINNMLTDVRLYDKGIKLLPPDLQQQLSKYLLKTLCVEISTEMLNYVAMEQNSNVSTESFSQEQRVKFVNDLPNDLKKAFLPSIKSLAGQSVDDFMSAIEDALQACSMIVKKIDKKRDRSVVLNHKHGLLEQLNGCEDLAFALHLAVLAIFTTATQCMLHASGKHLSAILSFLKQYLSEEQAAELYAYHDFVMLMLAGGSEAENAKEKLKEKINVVKSIANDYKRTVADKS